MYLQDTNYYISFLILSLFVYCENNVKCLDTINGCLNKCLYPKIVFIFALLHSSSKIV